MAGSSQADASSQPQSAADAVIMAKYHCECEIPEAYFLEALGLQYQDWKSPFYYSPRLHCYLRASLAQS